MVHVESKHNTPDGDNVTNDLLLDTYAKREKYANTIPDIMALNFIDFVNEIQNCQQQTIKSV